MSRVIPTWRRRNLRSQRLSGQAVAEQQVMDGGGGRGVLQPGRVLAGAVAVARYHLWLVHSDPAGNPVAERRGDDRRVVGEALGGAAHRPAAFVLEFLGKVPVIERGGRGDAALVQLVKQRPVVVEAFLVHGALAAGLNPRPARSRTGRP